MRTLRVLQLCIRYTLELLISYACFDRIMKRTFDIEMFEHMTKTITNAIASIVHANISITSEKFLSSKD